MYFASHSICWEKNTHTNKKWYIHSFSEICCNPWRLSLRSDCVTNKLGVWVAFNTTEKSNTNHPNVYTTKIAIFARIKLNYEALFTIVAREKNARECEKKNKIKTNNDNIVSTSIVKTSRKSEEYNLPVHSFINSSSIGMDHNFSVGFIKHTHFSDACILSACRCSAKI